LIVPCGIADRSVTSMQKLLSREVEMTEVIDRYAVEFGQIFNRNLIWMEEDALLRELQSYSKKVGESDVCVHH
jgi:lipoate-protein ligase B